MLHCSIFIDAYLTHKYPLSSRKTRIKIYIILSFVVAFIGSFFYWINTAIKLGGLNVTFL
jgi:hypothetical protein